MKRIGLVVLTVALAACSCPTAPDNSKDHACKSWKTPEGNYIVTCPTGADTVHK